MEIWRNFISALIISVEDFASGEGIRLGHDFFFRGGWQQTATGDTVELVEFCFMGFFFLSAKHP